MAQTAQSAVSTAKQIGSAAASSGISVVGDIAGGLIGQAFAKRNAEIQRNNQKHLMDYENKINLQNKLNNFSLEKQSMLNAGLNPAMMMQGSPQPVQSSGGSAQSVEGGKVGNLGTSAVQAMQQSQLNQANIQLAKAAAKKTQAEAEGTEIDNATRGERNQLSMQSTRATISDTVKSASWKEQQIMQSRATVENMQKTFEIFERNSAAQRMNMSFDNYLKYNSAMRIAKEVLWFDKRQRAEINEILTKCNLNSEQATQLAALTASVGYDNALKKDRNEFLLSKGVFSTAEQVEEAVKQGKLTPNQQQALFEWWKDKVATDVTTSEGNVQTAAWYQYFSKVGVPILNGVAGIARSIK